VPQCDLSDCIETLDAADNGATIKRLILTLAQSDPVAANLVHHCYDSHIRREQSKVIDFDPYSKHIWSAINSRYSRLSGSKQYEKAFEVLDDVTGMISTISQKASAQHTSFGTKRSALETLRKIGKTICLSGDTVGHEVRKQFQHESALEDAMIACYC
jgi:type II secretory ATPase GspE/PulE/Tfp pilus assembly ATPase PilB-like protein